MYLSFMRISNDAVQLLKKVLLQAKECNYPIGAELKCQLNIKAREYNGKWYNSIEAWKIESDAKIEPVQEYASQVEPSDEMPF